MNPKAMNSLAARVAKIESLLENQDTFGASGGATYGGLNYQGSQIGGVQFGDNYFQNQDQGRSNENRLDERMADNYGFGPTEATVNDLMQRIAELELLVAGGSRDTTQSGAQDAGVAVGDDGTDGAGDAGGGGGGGSGIPAGYIPITLIICENGVQKTMSVLGTTPV